MSTLVTTTQSRGASGNLLLPFMGAFVLLAIIAIGVLPAARETENTRAGIVRLQSDLRQQQALRPVFQSLQERKQRSLPEGVHVHQREPLKIDDLAALPEVFERLARASGVQLVSATPQVRSLRDGRELLRVDTRMRGKFPTFNALLNRLNAMPSVETIEDLGIDVTETGHELRLSIWLAIQ